MRMRTYRTIGQYYRQTNVYAPSLVRSDLTMFCPAAAAGTSCPAASPGQRSCPAAAAGQACPVQKTARFTLRKTFPSFGLSGLRGMRGLGAYSGSYYVDPTSGYSVEATGAGTATIFDSAGDTLYQSGGAQSTLLQNYGPFYVDADGNIFVGAVEIWDTQNGLTGVAPPTAASAAPPVSAAASTPAKAPAVAAAIPAPQLAPWWNRQTTLFGMTLSNTNFVALGGVVGLFALMFSGRRR